MLEIIQSMISQEQYDALDRISGELVELGYSDHLDAIVALETTITQRDPGALVQEVHGLLRNAADIVLDKFDVVVDAETPLNLLYFLLNMLRRFEATEDSELIEDIRNTAESTEDAFTEILALRTPISETVWMPYILKVSPDLIDTVATVAAEIDLETVQQTELPAVRVRELLVNDPESIVGVAIESCIPLQCDLDTLHLHYKERLNLGMEGTGTGPKYVEQLVKDLVGISVYGGIPQDELRDEVRVQLESYLIELDELQRAQRTLDKYLETTKC